MPKANIVIRRLKVDFRNTARSDLDQIFWYITDASGMPRTAHAYVSRIRQRCIGIINAPESGKRRDDLVQGLRTISFERSAIICYIIDNDTIWITNIFRRGRDYEAILRGDPQSEIDE